MLHELAVTDLGVIGELTLVLEPGMTAVTGETGAGKTLVVEAIELLMGGRADPAMVRHGASEAVVEGRFVIDGEEVVLRRVVPREGRSRAYVDGHLATAGSLCTMVNSVSGAPYVLPIGTPGASTGVTLDGRPLVRIGDQIPGRPGILTFLGPPAAPYVCDGTAP